MVRVLRTFEVLCRSVTARAFGVTLFAALSPALAWAAGDRVILNTGKPIETTGPIVATSPASVSVDGSAGNQEVETGDIKWIEYDEDPVDLKTVRKAFFDGDYADVVDRLKKIDASEITRDELKADLEFYRLIALARLAIAGQGNPSQLGKPLQDYKNKYKTSYHLVAVNEALGDVLVAIKKPDQAEKYYGELSKLGGKQFKTRENLLIANAKVAANKSDDALPLFDAVIGDAATGPLADSQKAQAKLGKALALSIKGDMAKAEALAEEVVAAAPKDDVQMHARAYNVLGACYLKAGKKEDALLNFLKTDLLYSKAREQHAEALANLAKLWPEVSQRERGQQAEAQLLTQYPTSRWAIELSGAKK